MPFAVRCHVDYGLGPRMDSSLYVGTVVGKQLVFISFCDFLNINLYIV